MRSRPETSTRNGLGSAEKSSTSVGFGNTFTGETGRKQVELRFELDPKRLSGRVAELLRSAEDIMVELVIGEGITSEQQDLSGDQVREIVLEDSCRVERFAVEVDGASLLSMSARVGGLLRLDRLEHGHPVFRELFRGILMLATTTEDVDEEDFDVLGDVRDSLVPGITARIRGLFPRIEEEFEASENKVEGWDAFMSVSRGRRREDLSLAARTFVPKALRELVGGLGAAIEGEIRRLGYLGPLRSYPPRHLTFTLPQNDQGSSAGRRSGSRPLEWRVAQVVRGSCARLVYRPTSSFGTTSMIAT